MDERQARVELAKTVHATGKGGTVMTEDAAHVFRLDNDVLAFRFTATLSHRAGAAPFERLASPERLRLWLRAAGLDPGRDGTRAELAAAIELREAVYRLAVATTQGTTRPVADVATLNDLASQGRATPALTGTGRAWVLGPDQPVTDALAVIAHDAIAVLGAEDTARIKICDGPDCAGLFLDTSRGNNRRWCSMNTCGNKAKKARMAGR
jgi:predicted RNA-binding Zn ribbon-like protein